MKKTNLRKMLTFLLTMVLLAGVLTGCRAEPLVIKDSDTYIVVKTTGEKDEMYLVEYMENRHADVLETIRTTGKLENDTADKLKAALTALVADFTGKA